MFHTVKETYSDEKSLLKKKKQTKQNKAKQKDIHQAKQSNQGALSNLLSERNGRVEGFGCVTKNKAPTINKARPYIRLHNFCETLPPPHTPNLIGS